MGIGATSRGKPIATTVWRKNLSRKPFQSPAINLLRGLRHLCSLWGSGLGPEAWARNGLIWRREMLGTERFDQFGFGTFYVTEEILRLYLLK